MHKPFLLLVAICHVIISHSQQPIDVTDQTIKIKGSKEEEIMLGFAAGDKIIFNLISDKELKEIEVLEYPNISRFSDYKTSHIENKQLNVIKQGVYIFRFKNSALGGRVCNIHIQRIPANETTVNFNTAVSWANKQDTSWNSFTKDVLVGYDTTYVQRTTKEITNTEQKEEPILDKNERVHSINNGNGNKTSIFFTLPTNTNENNKTTQVIAWAYWIGVGEEANQAWQSNIKAMKSLVTTGAKMFTTPIGALAIGMLFELATPKLGEDVYYVITNQLNRDLFILNQQYRFFDNGKGVAGFRKFVDPALCQGSFFICLMNDNIVQGINAQIKVSAIIETQTFQDRTYTEQVVTPKYEKQIMKEPVITTNRIPIAGSL